MVYIYSKSGGHYGIVVFITDLGKEGSGFESRRQLWPLSLLADWFAQKNLRQHGDIYKVYKNFYYACHKLCKTYTLSNPTYLKKATKPPKYPRHTPGDQ